MATQLDGITKTFTAGEDLTEYLLVKVEVTTGEVVKTEGSAGADKRVVGAVQPADGGSDDDLDDGKKVNVRLFNAGTMKVIAGTTVRAGDLLYSMASGKAGITVTSGTRVGIAVEAGDTNDLVEMVPDRGNDLVGTS